MKLGNSFWKNNLDNLLVILVFFGVIIIFTYLVFQGIANVNPFFENKWIFQMFDVGHEANVPTFFAVLLFIILSASALVCGIYDKFVHAVKKDWFPWIIVSCVLLFLSLDELAQVHEQLTFHTQYILRDVSGLFYFAWVIPYGILVVLFAAYLIPFFLKLPRYTRNIILLGAGVFILGALGAEMISARFYEIGGAYHPGFIIASSVEETMEIMGQLIAMFGLFREVSRRLDNRV